MKVLVLGGGSIRSSYQLGVVKGLFDIGYEPDVIVGISGGGLIGMLITEKIGGQHGDVIDYKLAGDDALYFWKKHITSPKSLIKKRSILSLVSSIVRKKFNGIYDNMPLKRLILNEMSHSNISTSRIKCVTGAVNLNTGTIRYRDNSCFGFISHTIASSSIPFIFPVSKIGSRKYIDGGVIDSTPLKEAFNNNPTEITCVLTSPEGIDSSEINEGNITEYIGRVIDIILANNLDNDIKQAQLYNELLSSNVDIKTKNGYLSKKFIPINIIRPSNQIDVKINKFTSEDIDRMIKLGYSDAIKTSK